MAQKTTCLGMLVVQTNPNLQQMQESPLAAWRKHLNVTHWNTIPEGHYIVGILAAILDVVNTVMIQRSLV